MFLGFWANNKTCAPRWFSGGESLNVVDDGHWERESINHIQVAKTCHTHPQLINLATSIKSASRLVIRGCWSGWQNGFFRISKLFLIMASMNLKKPRWKTLLPSTKRETHSTHPQEHNELYFIFSL
jgi:hypothetical protein